MRTQAERDTQNEKTSDCGSLEGNRESLAAKRTTKGARAGAREEGRRVSDRVRQPKGGGGGELSITLNLKKCLDKCWQSPSKGGDATAAAAA